MKLFAVTMIVALALGGCGPTDGQLAVNMCDSIKSNSAWGECYARARGRMDMKREISARQTEQAASLLLLGALAIGDGYNAGRRHRMTCTNLAGIITCD